MVVPLGTWGGSLGNALGECDGASADWLGDALDVHGRGDCLEQASAAYGSMYDGLDQNSRHINGSQCYTTGQCDWRGDSPRGRGRVDRDGLEARAHHVDLSRAPADFAPDDTSRVKRAPGGHATRGSVIEICARAPGLSLGADDTGMHDACASACGNLLDGQVQTAGYASTANSICRWSVIVALWQTMDGLLLLAKAQARGMLCQT